MSTPLQPGVGVRSFYAALPAAPADGPVPDDPGSLDGEQVGVVAEPERPYADRVEHNLIIYPTDYVSTSDGRQWTMPNGLSSMRLPRGSRWTVAELDAEYDRQSRLRLWQEQR